MLDQIGADQREPELGNLCFGHGSLPYAVPRTDRFQDAVYQLIEAATGEAEGYFEKFENDVFALRPYFWGDCTCWVESAEGLADFKETVGEDHEQTCYQWLYAALPHPVRHEDGERLCAAFGIPWNDGRGSAVHCTCGYDTRATVWESAHPHADECGPYQPNFHYKPTDFRLEWYKYPLRDSYANQRLTIQEFEGIIDACLRSLKPKE